MSEQESSGHWLLATTAAAFCWAAADILCDLCIGESEDNEMGEYEMVPLKETGEASMRKSKSGEELNSIVDEVFVVDKGDNVGGLTKRRLNSNNTKSSVRVGLAGSATNGQSDKKAVEENQLQREPEKKEDKDTGMDDAMDENGDKEGREGDNDEDEEGGEDDDDDDDDEEEMDGIQDCGIAGVTTGACMYVLSLRRVYLHKTAGSWITTNPGSSYFLWSPNEDLEWWLAAVSGGLMFLHYLFLLMAFDSAPSTVIMPLIQVSSTWMLLGSAIPAALTGSTFIRPFDLLCYFIIVLGGLLPSVGGNFKLMLSAKFWKQRFVRNVVISEVSVGVYDLIMSYTLQHSGTKDKFLTVAPSDIEFEFFFVAWCGFVVCTAFVFSFVPNFRERFINLRDLPRKVIILSALGQLLTLVGYFFSQYAYALYYQASIVHAAETSGEQALNLLFAVVAQQLGFGRESATDNLRIKMLSCVVVSVGLFMAGASESPQTTPTPATPPHPSADLNRFSNVQGLVYVAP